MKTELLLFQQERFIVTGNNKYNKTGGKYVSQKKKEKHKAFNFEEAVFSKTTSED